MSTFISGADGASVPDAAASVDSAENSPVGRAGKSSAAPDDSTHNAPAASTDASANPTSGAISTESLLTLEGYLSAALARLEASAGEPVVNTHLRFVDAYELLKERLHDVTTSVIYGYKSAYLNNNGIAELVEAECQKSLDLSEKMGAAAYHALSRVYSFARCVIRDQYAAALHGNALNPESIHGPVPMYTPARTRGHAAFDSSIVSFSLALQLIDDLVFHGLSNIHQAHEPCVARDIALHSLELAHKHAMGALDDVCRQASETIRKQFEAAISGEALQYEDVGGGANTLERGDEVNDIHQEDISV